MYPIIDKKLSQEFYKRLRVYMGEYENAPPAARDRYWDWWKDHAGLRAKWFEQDLAPRLELHRPLRGLRVAEFGCGTGSATQVLAKAGAFVLALEPEAASLAVAWQRIRDHNAKSNACFARIEYIAECGHGLPIKTNSLDLVVLAGVLEHMTKSERKACVAEAFRVLKPGGSAFVFDTPNRVYPFDHHTTRLWFAGWMPDFLAKKYAVFRKKFDKEKDFQRQGAVGMSRRAIDRLFPKNKWKVVIERDLAEVVEGFRWLANDMPMLSKRQKRAGAWLMGQAARMLVFSMKTAGVRPEILAHAHAIMFEKIR